jgi:hypothetical protein
MPAGQGAQLVGTEGLEPAWEVVGNGPRGEEAVDAVRSAAGAAVSAWDDRWR